IGFYTTLALMAGYVVLKWIFAGLAAWLQKGGELRSVVVVAERLFFILFVTLLIPIAFITKINEGVTLHFFMIYSLVVFAACYLLFLFREREFFLEYRTSFFYWILYLCTLELLPTGVFLSIII
ncbi:MAG: DUF4271 domain-containing protein, partial [Bacteroidales bacterium]|nr:DUF4271 domain-containing protein [Bacteroidales bacterium]